MKRFILFTLIFTLSSVIFSAEQAPLRFDPESETLVNMYCKAVITPGLHLGNVARLSNFLARVAGRQQPAPEQTIISSVAFSPDGNTLAIGLPDKMH